jgi:hypothetical protein
MARGSAERHKEARERLEQAVAALACSEGWRAWIRTRAAFRRYSLHNTILIAMQRPDATRVAGYRAWQKRPPGAAGGAGDCDPRSDDPKGKGRGRQRDRRGSHVLPVGVGVRRLADDRRPLAEPPREPITGDSHAALLPKLESHAAAIGYTVAYEAPGPAALGYCDRGARRIVVSPDQPANARVRTLIHELAHALGVGYAECGREAAEVIVESAATIACASAGLDTTGESVPYIADWGNGSTATIHEYAAKVDELAAELERACGIDPSTRA